MNLLIVGATGQIGRHLTTQALDAGHAVTAFGRSAAQLPPRPRMTPFAGDVTEAADVERALSSGTHDAVVATFGAPLNFDSLTHVPTVTAEGTANLLAAMRAHGPKRLVCMTMIGAHESRGHGRAVFDKVIQPVMLGRITADRERQEDLVRAADHLAWTIVRPTELADGERTGEYRVYEDLTGVRADTIARANVADFLLRCATDAGASVGHTYLITD